MSAEYFDSSYSYINSNSWLLVLVTAFVVVVSIIFRREWNKYRYWKHRGIDGPTQLPFVGNIFHVFFRQSISATKTYSEKYGKIFGLYDRSQHTLSVAEPELLRYILVKDSEVFINRRPSPTGQPLIKNILFFQRDNRWKRTRAIVSPTFTSGKIRRMTAMIEECIQRLIVEMDKKVESKSEINLKEMFGCFTIDVIACCAFATKTNTYQQPDSPFVANAKKFFQFNVWRLLLAVLTPEFIKRPFNITLAPASMMSFFKSSVKEIIKQRKANNVIENDFLQLLLDSDSNSDLIHAVKDINSEQLNNENHEDMEKNAKLLITDDGDSKLSEDEILAQCLLFFVAGYETTSSLLSYTCYALALNEKCQHLLYDEVKHFFDTDKDITYENIQKMKYLNAVINETLRMFTPFMKLERQAKRDYKLPNTDITVPKGAIVQIPVYQIHHDENNFPDPDSFKPERFLPENLGEIKPYTFLPFGSGPRNCVGMRFALMEAKLAICRLILRYKFVRSENTDVPLKMKLFTISLLPAKRVIIKCELRNN